jgi:hypothetical protein
MLVTYVLHAAVGSSASIKSADGQCSSRSSRQQQRQQQQQKLWVEKPGSLRWLPYFVDANLSMPLMSMQQCSATLLR